MRYPLTVLAIVALAGFVPDAPASSPDDRSSSKSEEPSERDLQAWLQRLPPAERVWAREDLAWIEEIERAMNESPEAHRKAVRRYRGVSVVTQDGATGDTLAIQSRIARRMAEDDFIPPDRSRHFGEMIETWFRGIIPINPSAAIGIAGWKAEILETSPTCGGVLVKLRVQARITAGNVFTNYHIYEFYEFSGGALRYLRSEESAEPMHMLICKNRRISGSIPAAA